MMGLGIRGAVLAGLIGVLIVGVSGCDGKRSVKTGGEKVAAVEGPRRVNRRELLMGFEEESPAVEWRLGGGGKVSVEPPAAVPSTQDSALTPPATGPTTVPATMPNGVMGRSSVRPKQGLWSLKVGLAAGGSGEVVHGFGQVRDLQGFDTLSAGVMHLDGAGRNGEFVGRLFIVDADGKRAEGDPMAITSRWEDLLLDLRTASDEGLDVLRVVEMGVRFEGVKAGEGVLEVQTDDWAGMKDYRAYEGERLGRAKSFYVERDGMRLKVGMAGGYEVVFYQRSGMERPWMSVTADGGRRMVLGQPGTGLMLLDQAGYEGIGGVHVDGFDTKLGGTGGSLPGAGWPAGVGGEDRLKAELRAGELRAGELRTRWECVWTSAVGAIVEMKQESGPYDRMGEPAAVLTWRFMIYQWGQVFVHVEWRAGESVGKPITWALVTEESAGDLEGEVKDQDRLLSGIYPASVKEGLETALPHRMQTGAGVAMIAKSDAGTASAKNIWWWARGGGKRVFGTGLSTVREEQKGGGAADCMLLVNSPTGLMQASSFGAYLVPPKVKVRQGELDKNFPGDVDNDGFVESYGFQVVRLSGGRASFVIYPQERPLFYPVYLFTVPAVEREAVGLKDSRVLINLDGKQFADPPRFPDGSFILQMPYVIDKPVGVEAILVRK